MFDLFRGSIPSLALRSGHSLRAASPFPVTGHDALLVAGGRLDLACAGLQPARRHKLLGALKIDVTLNGGDMRYSSSLLPGE